MKIYFIGQKGIPATSGGVERHVEEISTRLAREGHEVFVYCRNYYTQTREKRYKGVNLIKLPTIKTKHLDAIVHTFLATLDVLRRDADIIHYHAIGPASLLFIPKIFKRKTKIIFTFHCQDYKHQKWGWLAKAYLRLGEKIGCIYADKIITVSKTLQEYVWNKYKLEALYIPNGVLIPQINQGTNLIKHWGLGEDNYILTVNRLIKHKGIHYLIEAFQQLDTDKKLVIVGDSAYTDDYVDYLKEMAGKNKNIIFTGRQTGKVLAQLFRNAYLYVHPSEAEGLSLAILEALSFGRAVLASDIPENYEIIKNIGFLFRNKDIADLLEQLQFLIENPAIVKETSAPGQDHVAKNYAWEKIARETSECYSSILPYKENIAYGRAHTEVLK